MTVRRRHRGVLIGSILGIAVAVALAAFSTSLTEIAPGAFIVALLLALPFLLGLAPLTTGMPRAMARLAWVVAGIIAIPLGLLLFWTGAFVVYIPLAFVYFHAAATAAPTGGAEANTDPVPGSR